jgi:FtsH-binding integral membrane protein
MSYEFGYSASAAQASGSERAAFIRRVYLHLAVAILALIGVESVLLQWIYAQGLELKVLQLMMGQWWSWLVVLGLFMGVGYLARSWASQPSSVGLQYAGLALYVGAWAIMFLPLLIVANYIDPSHQAIATAGVMTGCVFGGLTLAALITRKDFSFLGPILAVGTMIALGVIVCAIFIGFSLGLLFSFAMVALISGYILYDTSNVLHHFHPSQHVAAALTLFADVAILFWYILQIVLASSRD